MPTTDYRVREGWILIHRGSAGLAVYDTGSRQGRKGRYVVASAAKDLEEFNCKRDAIKYANTAQ